MSCSKKNLLLLIGIHVLIVLAVFYVVNTNGDMFISIKALSNSDDQKRLSNDHQLILQYHKINYDLPMSIDKVYKNDRKESFLVYIDPGHQVRGNYEQEPIGPGATETKYKVTGGTTGVVTNKPEYVLVLEASIILKEILEAKGFTVK